MGLSFRTFGGRIGMLKKIEPQASLPKNRSCAVSVPCNFWPPSSSFSICSQPGPTAGGLQVGARRVQLVEPTQLEMKRYLKATQPQKPTPQFLFRDQNQALQKSRKSSLRKNVNGVCPQVDPTRRSKKP